MVLDGPRLASGVANKDASEGGAPARKEIEAALKQCILRLGYKALKTEQENAIVPFASPSEYQKNTLFLHLSTSETL